MSSYQTRFLNHLKAFMEDTKLIEPGETVWVAVSGGRDSMALLFCLHRLSRKMAFKLEAMSVNHGVRKGNDLEEKLVREFCGKLGIPLKVKHLKLKGVKNFEHVARKKRYEFFKACAGESKIALAHHVDDSFEWSFMQSFKSSNVKASLGIPLMNRNVIRPFLCVSRKQITILAQKISLPYLDDPTNKNEKYERNSLRAQIPGMIQKYPGYLRHYVYRSNELARQLNLSLKSSNVLDAHVKKNETGSEIYLLPPFVDFSGVSEALRELIHSFSKTERGRIHAQLEKAQGMMTKGSLGPLSFSGGVKVFASFHHLLVSNHSVHPLDGRYEKIKIEFKEYGLHDFVQKLSKELERNECSFPYFVLYSDEIGRVIFPMKRPHPFWPKLTSSMLARHLNFLPALRLIELWKKSPLKNKKIKLALVQRTILDSSHLNS